MNEWPVITSGIIPIDYGECLLYKNSFSETDLEISCWSFLIFWFLYTDFLLYFPDLSSFV